MIKYCVVDLIKIVADVIKFVVDIIKNKRKRAFISIHACSRNRILVVICENLVKKICNNKKLKSL